MSSVPFDVTVDRVMAGTLGLDENGRHEFSSNHCGFERAAGLACRTREPESRVRSVTCA
jgi:hypothetical protein